MGVRAQQRELNAIVPALHYASIVCIVRTTLWAIT